MFTKRALSLTDTGTLNKLVSDYISGKSETENLHSFMPDLNGYKNLLASEKTYINRNRALLTSSRLKQSNRCAKSIIG